MKVVVVKFDWPVEDLCDFLSNSGHEVHQLPASSWLTEALLLEPDFVIMSLNKSALKDNATFEIFSFWKATPFMVLVDATLNEQLRIKVFEAGASGLVSSPFGPAEVLARMRAILRRCQDVGQNVSQIVSNGLKLDLVFKKVIHNDQLVSLTPTEFELLRYLVQNRDKLITHRKLLEDVLGKPTAFESQSAKERKRTNHVLTVHMNNLRSKLEDDAANPKYIHAETRLGYRFRTTHS